MKLLPTSIFISLLLLLLVHSVSAKSSSLFVDHLATLIYNDCKGQDLAINQPYIVSAATNTAINQIPESSYDYTTVRRIVEVLGDLEPYAFFQGTCENKRVAINGGGDGCGIVTCGNNKLDINQYTYLWNGERVDVPKEEFKATYGTNSPIIETLGDKSPVTTGDSSPIQQKETNTNFFSKDTLIGTVIGAILTVLGNTILSVLKKRKKKLESKSDNI